MFSFRIDKKMLMIFLVVTLLLNCKRASDSIMLNKLQYIINSSSLYDEYVRVPKWKERLISTKRRFKSKYSPAYFNVYELSTDYAGGNSVKLIYYESPTVNYLFPLTDDFYYDRMSAFPKAYELEYLAEKNLDIIWEFNSFAHEQLSLERHLNHLISHQIKSFTTSDTTFTAALSEILEVVFVKALKCSVLELHALEAEYKLLSSHEKSLSDESYNYYFEQLNVLNGRINSKNDQVFVFKRNYFAYYLVEFEANSNVLKIDLIGKEKFRLNN